MPAKLTTLSQFSQHTNITSKASKGYKTYRVSLCQTVRLHSIDRAKRLRERVRARDFPLRMQVCMLF